MPSAFIWHSVPGGSLKSNCKLPHGEYVVKWPDPGMASSFHAGQRVCGLATDRQTHNLPLAKSEMSGALMVNLCVYLSKQLGLDACTLFGVRHALLVRPDL